MERYANMPPCPAYRNGELIVLALDHEDELAAEMTQGNGEREGREV
jgi:hypothetical protein